MPKRRRRSCLTKGLILGFGIPVLLFLILYIVFAVYFRSHFLWRTEINGLSVSGMTPDEAKDKIKEASESYLLTIYDRDGNKYHILILINKFNHFLGSISIRNAYQTAKTAYTMIYMYHKVTRLKLAQLF